MKHSRTRKNRILTDYQKDFVKKNWIVLSDKDLATYLETTYAAVVKLRQTLGLNRRNLAEQAKNIPLVLWMTRDAYKNYSDMDSISLELL